VRGLLRPQSPTEAPLLAEVTLCALVRALDAFSVTLAEVADSLEPHRLCGYLFAPAKM
jgi:arginyl-tRNA synthetase